MRNNLTKMPSMKELTVKERTKMEEKPQKRLQRHRSGFLERFGMKEVVCTGIIGIITGLTAAQF